MNLEGHTLCVLVKFLLKSFCIIVVITTFEIDALMQRIELEANGVRCKTHIKMLFNVFTTTCYFRSEVGLHLSMKTLYRHKLFPV